jgi:hypothetical protein
MNPIRYIRRLGAALAGLACTLLALGAGAHSAFASPLSLAPPEHGPAGSVIPGHLPPGLHKHPPLPVQVHTVIPGGMPGWQIALIAAGAALLAAAVAVLAYRAWAARRTPVTAVA